MSRVDSSIAKATRSLDSDVTEMLVQLLKHRSFGVRRLAGYTLQGVNQIDPKYLTDIKGAIDTTPWLVRALGRVSSPEAAYEAVKRYSVSSKWRGLCGKAFARESRTFYNGFYSMQS